jgi:riboflavin kinase / FMN adenylyltransferase
MPDMEVVDGVAGLRREHGPIFAVIGVFDGLHRGHAYLLDHLVREAASRSARPTVITFDHHPDEVLTGSAPPLLMDPEERLERLEAAGVEVTVVQPFDEALRRTTYDDFVHAIASRARLAGLLMTPDAAFGYQRAGTPAALTELGTREGFDVVVVEPFTIDGAAVRSSEVREAIAAGDLGRAETLLGRPVTIRGRLDAAGLVLGWPLALPPDGRYAASVDGLATILVVADDARSLRLDDTETRPAGLPTDHDVEVRLAPARAG